MSNNDIPLYRASAPVFYLKMLGVNQLSPEPSSIVVRGESPHSTPKLGVPEYAP